MKKIKIMLTVMVVLGAAGGVLAFKAKRDLKFCTSATVNGTCPVPKHCVNGTIAMVHALGSLKCYVLTNNTALCASDMPICHSTPVRLTAD